MTLASRKAKSDRRRTRKILVTQVKRGKYCEGVVYTYGDFQAELREPRARFTEPCSRYREACSSFRSLMCFLFLCFFNVSVAWGSLGEPKTFIFLCMFKVFSIILYSIILYICRSPQGYKYRTPGARGSWKLSSFSHYRWIRAIVISIAIILFLRMRTSGSLH